LRAAMSPILVFMDVEGAEASLLDLGAIPALQDVDLLIETHDSFTPGCTDTLKHRFAATHDIECFASRPRRLSDYPANFLPFLPRLFPQLAVDLMDERRAGEQHWLYLAAKNGPARVAHLDD
jgi:hypothetical protein